MAQINKSSEYFNTITYTGNSSTLSVTGVGFQPDWTWIKDRNSAGDDHALYDAVRGTTKRIRSNQTDTENTESAGLTSFDSDGFTVGTNGASNGDGEPFVAWNWLGANGTASNTDGSITSTVSANTTSGFSIVSYTGTGANATIGHGLSSVPKTIIIKNRSTLDSWMVYHVGAGSNAYFHLETTNGALSPSTAQFQATTPTSSVFYVGTSDGTNKSSSNMIAYCFAEKKGFSKFGTYTGNGNNANGAFVYTGFKPAFVIFKRTNDTGNWQLLDNKRLGYNPLNYTLYPNTSLADQDEGDIYLYSNGFQLRGTGTDGNGSGSTYIYMAFAESPLVGTNNIPATAR